MKIIFTGGGSGGHFYPIIAVAEALREIEHDEKLLKSELTYMAPEPYDEELLFRYDIQFSHVGAGKMRRYFSVLNFFDLFKTAWGVIKAFFKVFFIFPDVVFSKGGFASFPALLAARFFRIPVVIHESDIVPGRANVWAAKFAHAIAISYPETVEAFPGKNVAFTGNPVRKELRNVAESGAHEYLNLAEGIPTIFIQGGSQGAQTINEAILEALPELVEKFQIIHQTGKQNYESMKATAEVILAKNPYAERYHPFGFLNTLAMRMAAGAADIVISRAGSGALFEIALWGLPSIIIPIPEEVSHDQRKNAFAYARSGAAIVIEQENLSPHILVSEIIRILSDEAKQKEMMDAARSFAQPEAAHKIAREILDIALEHEQ